MIMLFHNYDIMFYDYVSYLHPPLRSATSLREHVTSGRGSKTPTANHRRPLPFWTGCCGSSLRGVEWCEATNVGKQIGFECVLCLSGPRSWAVRSPNLRANVDGPRRVPPTVVATVGGTIVPSL